MPSYFTQYWTNRQWEWDRLVNVGFREWPFRTWGETPDVPEDPENRNWLGHTAGNLFRKAGVLPGDTISIITVKRGRLLLGGKIVVERICGQREAAKILGSKSNELYEAREHIIAAKPQDTLRYDFVVPTKIVRALQFESADGPKPPKFKEHGILDQQTLRGVRRLTGASAKLLTDLLKVKAR